MADTTYSAYCSRAWKPSGSNYTKQYRVRLDTTLNTYATYCNISYTHYLSLSSSVTHNGYHWYVGGYTSGSGTVNSKVGSGNTLYYCTSGTSSAVTRTHVAQTIYVSGSLYASSSGGSNTWNNETVTATKSYTVPPLDSYVITYNANGGTGTVTDGSQKWYGETLTLSSGAELSRSGYKLLKWNTEADGSGVDYALGPTGTYTGNEAITLYAIWQANPTCTATVSSSAPYYTGKASYSVNITNASVSTALDPNATIDSIVLALGSQTASRSSNGSLSITPSTAGSYTPTVTITDSLGASTTYTLTQITVKQYSVPIVVFSVERTTSNGTTEETLGTSCVISATFTFCSDAYKLQAPTVTYSDGTTTTQASISWYTSRSATGVVSNAVNWNNIVTGGTIYGLITSAFLTTQSYTISITPRDARSTGAAKTQTLSMALYPIDFFAGGKGVAFGRAANDEGLFSDMEATFEKDVHIIIDGDAASGTIDGDLIAAFTNLGWTIHS